MSSYKSLARLYDSLTTDVDYERWADYFQEHFKRSGKNVNIVLDLACGTGSLACILAERGYELIGVDKSEDMLMEALEKAADLDGNRPMFLQQSMDELDLYGTVDAALCCLDSVNYVTDPKMLQTAFERIHLFLDPGGIFIFDINSPLKFEEMNGELYMDENEDVCCIWRVDLDENLICTYCMDIFQRSGKLWKRDTEIHEERVYPPQEITDMLLKAGFIDVRCFGDLSFDKPKGDEMRLFFTARKENPNG